MTYIGKILAEFDKEFAHVKITDRHYFNPWIPEMKSFIIKSINQAIAEERERVREKIENAIKYINWSHSVGSHSDDSGGDSDVECTCKEDEARYKTEAYKNTLSFLSPLDKPLADNINDI